MEGDENNSKDNIEFRSSADDKKNTMLGKFGMGFHTSKFKSVFDKEGNPFKYFKDIKKHINTSSMSMSIHSKLENSKISKHNSNLESNVLAQSHPLKQQMFNNTNTNTSTCILSQNTLTNDLKLNCCIDSSNKLIDKIVYFLEENLLSDSTRTYSYADNKAIVDQLKYVIRSELSKIGQKFKGINAYNLSNVSEINNEANFMNKNVNQIVSKPYNNDTYPSNNTTDFKLPQKIIVNNIKQIINTNNNSRNHKDIIHEDQESDQNKYNLNELNRSDKSINTINTNNTNQIVITERITNQVQTGIKSDSSGLDRNNMNFDRGYRCDTNIIKNVPGKLGRKKEEKDKIRVNNHKNCRSLNKISNNDRRNMNSFSPSVLLNFNKIRYLSNEEYQRKLKYSLDPSVKKKGQSKEKKISVENVKFTTEKRKANFSKEKEKDNINNSVNNISHIKSRNNIYNSEWYKNFSRLTDQNKYSRLKNLYEKNNMTSIKENMEQVDYTCDKPKTNISISNITNLNKKLIYRTSLANSINVSDNNSQNKAKSSKIKKSSSPVAKNQTIGKYNLYKKESKKMNNQRSSIGNTSNSNNTNNISSYNALSKSLSKKEPEYKHNKMNIKSKTIENDQYNGSKSKNHLDMKNLNMSRNVGNLITIHTSTAKSTTFEKFKTSKILKAQVGANKSNKSQIGKDAKENHNQNAKLKDRTKPSDSVKKSKTTIFNNNYVNNLNYFTTFAPKPTQVNKNASNLDIYTSDTNNQNKSTELMKEIKKNCDENYKNFFNFSYDNYLNKDHSSDSHSDEVLITNESAAYKENIK